MESKQQEALRAAPVSLPESAGEVVTKLLELARIVYNAADDWGETHEDGTSTVIFQKREADALDAIFGYFDTLPENPDPLILDSGPLKAARTLLVAGLQHRKPNCITCNDQGAVGNILTAEPCSDCTPPQVQADVLNAMTQAVRDYHFALDTRQHGGVAAGKALDAIQQAIGLKWVQGAEASARAAIAAPIAAQGGA